MNWPNMIKRAEYTGKLVQYHLESVEAWERAASRVSKQALLDKRAAAQEESDRYWETAIRVAGGNSPDWRSVVGCALTSAQEVEEIWLDGASFAAKASEDLDGAVL